MNLEVQEAIWLIAYNVEEFPLLDEYTIWADALDRFSLTNDERVYIWQYLLKARGKDDSIEAPLRKYMLSRMDSED